MATPVPAPTSTAPKRDRSPNFPSLSLPEALKKAEVIHTADGRVASSPGVVLKHLGYGEKLSGSAGRVIAALRQYGLLEDVGDDKYRVTEATVQILQLPHDSTVRKAAVQACARKPAMFRDVLTHFPERLPSDAALGDYLITEKKFVIASVPSFIRALKGTIQFAKLYDAAYTPLKETTDETVAVGDYAQWESQGTLQFQVPKKVVGLSDDGEYAFFEGEATGIPVDELTKADPPPPAQRQPPSTPPHLQAGGTAKLLVGVERETFPLGNGVVALEWPNTIDADGLQDVEAWLAVVIRKLKRLTTKTSGEA